MATNSACAFTGHRPQAYRFGYDEKHPDCLRLKALMREEILKLIHSGISTFLSGMAQGADTWGAEIVLELEKFYPHLHLIAVLPCETQANLWSDRQRERYFSILSQCSQTVYTAKYYTPDCMLKRNRWLVDHSNVLLAIYNPCSQGGTAYTVQYAYQKKRTVMIINPEY